MKHVSDADLNTLAARFAWLSTLEQPAQERLVGQLTRHALPRGTIVFDVGSPCQGFPLVVAGSIRVCKAGPEGRELLLYRIGPGESCILTSGCLLGASDYTARAVVDSDVTLFALPRAAFLELLSASPAFRESVFNLFAERLAELMALVDAVAFHRLDQRLAARLLGHGGQIVTSHQALALELGSVREIISRVLGEFAQRGLVVLSRGHIEIRDAAGLRQVAQAGL